MTAALITTTGHVVFSADGETLAYAEHPEEATPELRRIRDAREVRRLCDGVLIARKVVRKGRKLLGGL